MLTAYFDNAASTPLDKRVFEEMKDYFFTDYGNASSLHSFGQKARFGIEKSRETIAKIINAKESEIYFTSGGTESDNLALKGTAFAYKDTGNHIITSSIEHPAVLNTCKFLESCGFMVTYLPVDGYGTVNPSDVEKAITEKTILVSIMHANNEVGTINDIEEIGKITRDKGVLFHSDAVQTFGKIPIDVNKFGIDLLTFSGHKIFGPKGIGVLYIRKKVNIQSQIHGGDHQRDRRAGTENVPGIVGIGKAAEIKIQEMESESKSLCELENYFRTKLCESIDDIVLNGHIGNRLAGFLNISFEKTHGEVVLLSLDLEGIAVSSGSACSSGSSESSHVLKAMSLSPERIISSIRITLGKQNTKEEVDYALSVFPKVINRIRKL